MNDRSRVEPSSGERPVPDRGAQPGNEPTTPQVLDPEVLGQYESMSPGFAAELIELFERDVPPRLERLRATVVAGDWKAVAEVAHSLKGTSGNIGAAALAEACASLNESAARGDGERIAVLAGEVERAWVNLEAALAAMASASETGDGHAASSSG